VLNLDSLRADTVSMGSITDGQLVGLGADGPGVRRRHRSGNGAELQKLREKVSLLSMQKDYWWQRYTEGVEECRAAQRKVLELKKALAELTAPGAGNADGAPRRAYVDPRLLS